MDYVIRKAELSDIEDVRTLMALLTGHEMSVEEAEARLHMIDKSPIEELFVLEAQTKIKGLLGFRIRENLEESSRYGEISVIVTDPHSRRSGFGRALMEFAQKRAREKGCKGTWLVSGFGREEEAHKFYSELGYKITGYRFVRLFEGD